MVGRVSQHPIMAARANSAAQLKDLGGVSGALSLLESTTHSDGVRESAALALANCTQRDDDVCVALGGVGANSLRAFVDQMTCTYTCMPLDVGVCAWVSHTALLTAAYPLMDAQPETRPSAAVLPGQLRTCVWWVTRRQPTLLWARAW